MRIIDRPYTYSSDTLLHCFINNFCLQYRIITFRCSPDNIDSKFRSRIQGPVLCVGEKRYVAAGYYCKCSFGCGYFIKVEFVYYILKILYYLIKAFGKLHQYFRGIYLGIHKTGYLLCRSCRFLRYRSNTGNGII